MSEITIVGGGLAGLTAAIAVAEAGTEVRLIEAHGELGGRARSAEGPYRANLGPHVLYADGPQWRWLDERNLIPPHARPPLRGLRFRWRGRIRRTPPWSGLPAVLRMRRRQAPADVDFRTWATEQSDEQTAGMLSNAAGVFSFHHDPGALSAAFVWERTVRVLLTTSPAARYVIGGWGVLVDTLERRLGDLGVEVVTGQRVQTLPDPPVIVATELPAAAELLGDEALHWPGGRTVCLDLGLRRRRGDPFVVSDLDEAGWIERFSLPDRTLAPAGHSLIQAQMPAPASETPEQAGARLERLLDASVSDWRERETWRRRQLMDARSGAVDPPGTTWRDRPAIDRGDGVFLAGDAVAAPGLLSEVSWASGLEAARGALAVLGQARTRLVGPA